MRVSTLLTTATLAALASAPNAVVAAPQPLTIITVTAQDMSQAVQHEVYSMLHNPTDYFSSIWGSASNSASQGWSNAKQRFGDATQRIQDEADEAAAGIRDVCPDLKVSCMKDGKTVEHGDTQAVFDNPQQPYTHKLMAAAFARSRKQTVAL